MDPSQTKLSERDSIGATAHPLSMVVAAKLAVFVLVCAILYLAKAILVPVALATFLTFIFAPVVKGLQTKARLPRVVAIIVALGFATAFLGAFSWFAYQQVAALAAELPNHRLNILKKVSDVRDLGKDSALDKVTKTIESISEEVEKIEEEEEQRTSPDPARRAADKPVVVTLAPKESPLGLDGLAAFAPAAAVAGTAGLVVLLTFFFLIYREDLRNRMLSFAGEARLIVTTRALHDAGTRISRYLFAQAMVNLSYGAAAGLGLWGLDVPYALLWGAATVLLRYIPYVGAWIGALLPVAASLVVFSGWTQPLLVVALFVVLELVSNNVMEPWLYRRSVGLSEVAIILSAIVWAFLWGPVGLVLATPLSVCIVVLGKFVPGLGFLSRLMGADPALDPASHFYHRLASLDAAEAEQLLRRQADRDGTNEALEGVVIPALALAARDHERGVLPQDEADDIAEAAAAMAEEFPAAKNGEEPPGEPGRQSDESTETPEPAATPPSTVIGLPAANDFDAAALEIFARTRTACSWELAEVGILASEVVDLVRLHRPAAVCIVAVSHRSFLRARRWCKRLRREFPSLSIIVGKWDGATGAENTPSKSGEDWRLGLSPAETWSELHPRLGLQRDAADSPES